MVTCIVGFTGQGKSTLALYLARRKTTRIIIDPRNQYDTTEGIIVTDLDELYDRLDSDAEIIIKPPRGSSVEETFDAVCRIVADWIEDNPLEPLCLLVDEARLVGLDSKSPSLQFDWIVRSAREGSPIDVVITCHRPVDLHPNIRAISNRLCFFRVMLPGDLETIEDQCGPDFSEEVKKLLDREFMTWNNSRQQSRKFDKPEMWLVRIQSNGVTAPTGIN